jgi:hypothetical protein
MHMQTTRRAVALGAAALATLSLSAAVSACSLFGGAADSASSGSATTTRPTAAPGTYGVPADPSMPNPTNVATDAPITMHAGTSLPLVVTYAGWQDGSQSVEAAGYVSGIAESHGTCTLTLTQSGHSATATGSGLANGTSTGCSRLSVPRSQLSSGTWTAVLTYSSPTSSAQSDKTEVRVP